MENSFVIKEITNCEKKTKSWLIKNEYIPDYTLMSLDEEYKPLTEPIRDDEYNDTIMFKLPGNQVLTEEDNFTPTTASHKFYYINQCHFTEELTFQCIPEGSLFCGAYLSYLYKKTPICKTNGSNCIFLLDGTERMFANNYSLLIQPKPSWVRAYLNRLAEASKILEQNPLRPWEEKIEQLQGQVDYINKVLARFGTTLDHLSVNHFYDHNIKDAFNVLKAAFVPDRKA